MSWRPGDEVAHRADAADVLGDAHDRHTSGCLVRPHLTVRVVRDVRPHLAARVAARLHRVHVGEE